MMDISGWFSLQASEAIRNNTLCVQDGATVRNIYQLNDYTLPLVIVSNISVEPYTESLVIQKGEMVRCIRLVVVPGRLGY